MARCSISKTKNDRIRSNKIISIAFFSRLILGGIFLYSGIYKVLNSFIFETALYRYDFLPSNLVKIVSIAFPWIEIIIGAFFISKILIRYTASLSVLLLIFFIVLTIRSSFKGLSASCGCFPESSILSSNDPIILIIRNHILLLFSIIIVFAKKGIKSKPIFNIKAKVPTSIYLYILSISLSILLILIGKRINENKYYSQILNERQTILNEVNKISIKKIEEYDLKYILNIDESLKNNKNVFLFIILNSLNCGTCIEEAIYVEKLNRKYGDKIKIYAVVGNVGKTAIKNFKNTYNISYEFIEKDNKSAFNNYKNIRTLKIIMKYDGLILNIDPVTFNMKSLQNEYENLLIKSLK